MTTDNQKLDKIKSKLEKLLRLQEGAQKIGSLEEAANAATKIQTLLLKYNLEMADISVKDDSGPNFTHDDLNLANLGRVKTSGSWMETLANVIAINNLCRAVFAKPIIMIFGKSENIKVVNSLITSLVYRLKDMSKQSFKEYYGPEKRNTYFRGYLMGAVQGIAIKLKENKEEQQRLDANITTLVVQTEKLVAQHMKDHFGDRLRPSRNRRMISQDGADKGFMDGKQMDINQQQIQ